MSQTFFKSNKVYQTDLFLFSSMKFYLWVNVNISYFHVSSLQIGLFHRNVEASDRLLSAEMWIILKGLVSTIRTCFTVSHSMFFYHSFFLNIWVQKKNNTYRTVTLEIRLQLDKIHRWVKGLPLFFDSTFSKFSAQEPTSTNCFF